MQQHSNTSDFIFLLSHSRVAYAGPLVYVFKDEKSG